MGIVNSSESVVDLCSFEHANKEKCQRVRHETNFCEFHTPHDTSANRVGDEDFLLKLKELIDAGDGDWRGFVFPKVLTLELKEISIPINATGSVFGAINIKQCKFLKSIDVSKSKFLNDFECSNSTFSEGLNFNESIFNGKCKFTTFVVNSNIQAHTCKFQGDFFLSGTIKGSCNLNQSVFEQQVKFIQTKMISVTANQTLSFSMNGVNGVVTLSNSDDPFFRKMWAWLIKIKNKIKHYIIKQFTRVKGVVAATWKKFTEWTSNKYRITRQRFPHKREGVKRYVLFEGDAHLQNMIFDKPNLVLFQGVDLSKALFGGTDLREVTFIGNMWYQPKLGRNGLIEELRYKGLTNYYDRREALPALENTYRNIRYALENTKDFANANDFFIGEMESKRKQLPTYKRYLFSVDAIYNVVSKYGTDPLRCALWFVLLAVFHSALMSTQINVTINDSWDSLYHSLQLLQDGMGVDEMVKLIDDAGVVFSGYINSDSLLYSLQTMTLQRDKLDLIPKGSNNIIIPLINFLFAILGPVTAALFALTVRTRIKRH